MVECCGEVMHRELVKIFIAQKSCFIHHEIMQERDRRRERESCGKMFYLTEEFSFLPMPSSTRQCSVVSHGSPDAVGKIT
jgi:hypothetical protein